MNEGCGLRIAAGLILAGVQVTPATAQSRPLADPQERVIQDREGPRPGKGAARRCDLCGAGVHDVDATDAADLSASLAQAI